MKRTWKISIGMWSVLTLLFVSCAYNLKGLTLLSKNETVEKASEELKSTTNFQEVLRLIAKSLKPSVVNIQVTMKPARTNSSTGDRMMDELLKRFFGQGFGGTAPDEQQEGQGSTAMGSGFIVSKDGYIVTNAHVVKNAKTITVTLENQTNYTAELVGIDIKTDIALLKIRPKFPLVPAPIGDSDSIDAGDFAVAIGNPFGLTGTLTFGIISAKGRNNYIEENAAYKNYIQTDVPINPGNSGGPLINIHGQVIGMNSAIYSTSGGSIGIGFAIPVNIVKNVIQQLLQTGHVTRGTIGVLIGPVPKDIVKSYHLANTKGVIVNDVVPDTPAQKAGLRTFDVITAINGKDIDAPGDFVGQISAFSPGQKIVLNVIRAQAGAIKKLRVSITIGDSKKENTSNSENPKDENSQTEMKWQGMSLTPMKNAKEEGLTVPANISGLVVTNVESSSKVASAGVVPGDVIVRINQSPVESFQDLKRLTNATKVAYVQFYSRQLGRNLLMVLP